MGRVWQQNRIHESFTCHMHAVAGEVIWCHVIIYRWRLQTESPMKNHRRHMCVWHHFSSTDSEPMSSSLDCPFTHSRAATVNRIIVSHCFSSLLLLRPPSPPSRHSLCFAWVEFKLSHGRSSESHGDSVYELRTPNGPALPTQIEQRVFRLYFYF